MQVAAATGQALKELQRHATRHTVWCPVVFLLTRQAGKRGQNAWKVFNVTKIREILGRNTSVALCQTLSVDAGRCVS